MSISQSLRIQKRLGGLHPQRRIPERSRTVDQTNIALQQSQPGNHNRQVYQFRKVFQIEIVLVEQVSDNQMNQRRSGQQAITVQFCIKRDDSFFSIVFSRQTAESFAGSAASATTSGFLHHLGKNTHLQTADLVIQVLANVIGQLPDVLAGFR